MQPQEQTSPQPEDVFVVGTAPGAPPKAKLAKFVFGVEFANSQKLTPGPMNARLRGSQTLYALSSVQREIWFDQSLFPNTPVYNIGGYLKIDGKIDPHVFCQAITLLVQETDVLRLVLTERNGIPLQAFPEMPQVPFEIHDCSGEDDPMQVAQSCIQQSIRRPFRIFEEPLFRFTL